MFSEFVCGFKDKFFFVQPFSDGANRNVFASKLHRRPGETSLTTSSGDMRYELAPKFTLQRRPMHYGQDTDAYIVKAGSLIPEDQDSYDKLVAYVGSLGVA